MSRKRKNGSRSRKVRKTVVTIKEGKNIDVSIQFFPAVTPAKPCLCDYVGMKAFFAAVDEVRRLEQGGEEA